jgi:hypothetical protein
MQSRIISLNIVLLLCCNVSSWTREFPATSTQTPDSLSVKVGETVLITRSQGYCWFPNVHRLSTGELFLTLGLGPDTTDPEANLGGTFVNVD